jgi:hypothetical protein
VLRNSNLSSTKRSPCRFQTFACRRTENRSPAGRSCFEAVTNDLNRSVVQRIGETSTLRRYKRALASSSGSTTGPGAPDRIQHVNASIRSSSTITKTRQALVDWHKVAALLLCLHVGKAIAVSSKQDVFAVPSIALTFPRNNTYIHRRSDSFLKLATYPSSTVILSNWVPPRLPCLRFFRSYPALRSHDYPFYVPPRTQLSLHGYPALDSSAVTLLYVLAITLSGLESVFTPSYLAAAVDRRRAS